MRGRLPEVGLMRGRAPHATKLPRLVESLRSDVSTRECDSQQQHEQGCLRNGSPAICLAEFDNRTQAEDNDSLDMERVPVGCMATTNAALARLQSHSQRSFPNGRKRTKIRFSTG